MGSERTGGEAVSRQVAVQSLGRDRGRQRMELQPHLPGKDGIHNVCLSARVNEGGQGACGAREVKVGTEQGLSISGGLDDSCCWNCWFC